MLRGKKLKEPLSALLAIIMVFALVGCAPTEAKPAATDASADASTDTQAEETQATFTAEAGTVYNIVAKEDIVIGFNNGSSQLDFMRMVEAGLADVCEREGIKFIRTESNFDVEQILPNVDNLLAQGANVIIDFNVNAEVGGNLVDYCAEKGVPVIGIDVVYTAPSGETSWFFGANNQMAGEVAGEALAKAINERWDGEIEDLVLFFNSENGELVKKRLSGYFDGLVKAGIDITEDQVTWIEMGGGGSDTTIVGNEKMTDWLASHPDSSKVCVGVVNAETGQGVFAATVTSNRSEDVILATQNNGNQALAAWETPQADVWLGGTAYYPGKYGEYLVPLVVSLLSGENTSKVTTMEHEFLTIEDIDIIKAEMGLE